MSFTGVNVNKLQGGLGRTGDANDRVVVLVMGMPEIDNKVAHYKPLELLQLSDAEKLGITFDNDIMTGSLAYYHISEVFRLSPEQRLWLIPVPKTNSLTGLVQLPDFISAIRTTAGNTIGIAGVPFGADMSSIINTAQTLVDSFAKEFHYIDSILLEGEGIPSDVTQMENLRTNNAPNISVVIAVDPAIVELNPSFEGTAAIGTVLGSLSVRAVHENIGSVDIEQKPRTRRGEPHYDISSQALGRWLNIALSNGTPFMDLSLADQNEITRKGYIFTGSFQGYGGVFLSNSPTCVAIDSDYSYIEYNAVWNKAAKAVRNALLPRVRSKVEIDPVTGFIRSTTITNWDGIARRALEPMVGAGNISAFDIYINPEQKAVGDKPLVIRIQLVAHGIVHEFDVDLGYTTQI